MARDLRLPSMAAHVGKRLSEAKGFFKGSVSGPQFPDLTGNLGKFKKIGRWTGPGRRAGPGPRAQGPGPLGAARLPGPVYRGFLYIFQDFLGKKTLKSSKNRHSSKKTNPKH